MENLDRLKVLFFDLENVQRPDQLFHPGRRASSFAAPRQAGFCANLSYILCMGYGFLDSDEIKVIKKTDQDFLASPIGDLEILREIYDVIESADVLIGWNSSGHDLNFLKARLAQIGLYLDPKKRHIDLMKIAQRSMNLSSYSMDGVASFFGTTMKDKSQPLWWAETWSGNIASYNKIADYCMGDILTLRELYLKMRNLIPNHPNMTVFRKLCPTCGEDSLIGNGIRVTQGGRRHRMRCTKCGANTSGDPIKV